MTIKTLFAAACIGAITIISANGDSDDLIQLVLNYGESSEARFSCHEGMVQPVSVHINNHLPFILEVPSEKKEYPVMVADLDGGQVNAMIRESEVPLSGNPTPPALFVSANGTIQLAFQAGNTTGLYRILVTVGVEQYQLRIYVINP